VEPHRGEGPGEALPGPHGAGHAQAGGPAGGAQGLGPAHPPQAAPLLRLGADGGGAGDRRGEGAPGPRLHRHHPDLRARLQEAPGGGR